MADVDGRPPVPGAGEHGGGRDRGQLILVTALSLAILFVALALILNTAIYTENLATRSSDIGGGTDAVRYHDAARDGVAGVIDYVIAHNNSSHSTLQSNLSAGVDAFRNHSARLFAAGDRAVETTLEVTVDGTRIAQSDVSRNFSNTSGEGNWTVATSVDNTRKFRMNVTGSALDTLSGQPFTVIVDDGGTTWRMNVTDDSGDIVVRTASATCRVTAASAWINVTAGTLAGSECEGFTFAEGVTGTYSISFENSSNVEGTYSLIVDEPSVADSPSPHLVADGSGQPFAAHAIYSANVTIVYQTPRLYYNATVRVAPGESDG